MSEPGFSIARGQPAQGKAIPADEASPALPLGLDSEPLRQDTPAATLARPLPPMPADEDLPLRPEVVEPGRALALADFSPPPVSAGERFMRFAYRLGLPAAALHPRERGGRAADGRRSAP